jgi:uncharacterized membrane protein YphA (DoxX/SURF4 family)
VQVDQMQDQMRAARRNRGLLAGLRIFMGLLFLETWVENLHKGLYGAGYAPFIEKWAAKSSIGPYADFLRTVVIPHAALFRTGQMVTELVVMGTCLLVGFCTPVAAVVASLFALNLLLASFGTGEWYGTYLMMIALLVVVGASRSGRTVGVDAVLARRRPHPRLGIW